MTTSPPTALTIAGSDSGGGAGVQADQKTFLACRVHGMSAITAVTVQNSRGVTGFYELPPHAVAEQIEAVASDIGVQAAKTGMLASAEIPLATVVTPNLGEVKLLTGFEARDRAGMQDAARALHALGPKWVLIKGGHLPDGAAVDVLFDGERFVELSSPRKDTVHTHGSGDTLAAAICAGLAHGMDVADAVRSGKRFITGAVTDSFPLGAGLGPVGHFWRVREWP